MSSTSWVTVRRCAEDVGRSEGTIRRAIKESRVRSRRVKGGRVEVSLQDARAHFEQLAAAGVGRPAGASYRPGEMTAADFAARVGVAERIARQWRKDGRVTAFTDEQARAVIEQRAGAVGGQSRVAIDDDMDSLKEADLHDIRRRKEYEQARLAKIKADEAEGRVYPAEEVESRVRHLAQSVDALLREVVMMFPGKLTHQSDTEIRSYLARWAQDKRDDLRRLSGVG